MSDTCKSCGAPIIWAVFEKTGAKTPINPEPMHGGNLVFTAPSRVRSITPGEKTLQPKYVSHFATCVNAGKHRRKCDAIEQMQPKPEHPAELRTVPEAYNAGLRDGAATERERIARMFDRYSDGDEWFGVAEHIREAKP